MPPKKVTQKQKRKSDTDTEDEVLNKSNSTKRPRLANSKTNNDELKFDLEWNSYEDVECGKGKQPPLYYLSSKTLPGCEKIAAFDIDFTVISTKSGKNFAINSKDWQWFDKCVPAKLKELNDDGYRVVFISNQGGIEKGQLKFADLKEKLHEMLSQLDIPVYIFISTGETHFRKPSSEMWSFLVDKCNQNVKVDMSKCFYVGDAAGRVKNWAPGKKKDFSCSDRMFAHNCGLAFHTPEEFFLGHKKISNFEWGSINPTEALKKYEDNSKNVADSYHSAKQEIILLMGPPASGKTTFFNRYLASHNYVHVNRDTLQTPAKCIKATEQALSEGKSVCVDNTNPSRKARAEYLDIAKKLKFNIRCFILDTHIELCHHLNYVRQNQTKSKVRRIPDVGYNMFKSQYEDPSKDEGFSEIIKIPFYPKFESDEHEAIFKQWTT